MAMAMGSERPSAADPARIRTSRISSVAYATEDRASEAKTARALTLESRSWISSAVGRGGPTIRLRTDAAMIATCGLPVWVP